MRPSEHSHALRRLSQRCDLCITASAQEDSAAGLLIDPTLKHCNRVGDYWFKCASRSLLLARLWRVFDSFVPGFPRKLKKYACCRARKTAYSNRETVPPSTPSDPIQPSRRTSNSAANCPPATRLGASR